jgi:hypothetical protein
MKCEWRCESTVFIDVQTSSGMGQLLLERGDRKAHSPIGRDG